MQLLPGELFKKESVFNAQVGHTELKAMTRVFAHLVTRVSMEQVRLLNVPLSVLLEVIVPRVRPIQPIVLRDTMGICYLEIEPALDQAGRLK